MDNAWWAGQPGAAPAKRFPGARRTTVYAPMADGTRISLDVYLPEGLPPGERVPTVLIPTPYFKSMEFRRPVFERIVGKLALVGAAEFAAEITKYGYANVVMELRGAGASFGQKKSVMMTDAVRDGAQVLDWIVAQPWSNLRVGATGISGPGMISLWFTTAKHPALRAVAPRFTTFDIFECVHPGGLLVGRFLQDMGALLDAMDNNRLHRMPENKLARLLLWLMVRGLRPADEDRDRSLLRAAVADHAANEHFDQDLGAVTYRDDLLPGASVEATIETQSPFLHAVDIEASETPIYGWAGWLDGPFGRDMISLFNTVRTPGSKIVIGPWGHGGRWYSSPLVVKEKKRPTSFDHVAEMVRFFDRHLRDAGAVPDADDDGPIHYYTMGEERWKAAREWPPPGAAMRPLYLGASGGLDAEAAAADEGFDEYRVDFTAGTGVHSRFGKHLSGGRYPVRYPNRAEADRKLLTYTSSPIEADLEVTGHPLATLFVSSTATDGAFLLYVEDVAPDGTVLNVTDGGLRAVARAVGDVPYWRMGPFHPFRRTDEMPLVPGEVTELSFDLFPVSWLFRAGHRIRVAIAGADKDNFVPIAEQQSPVIRVYRSAQYPSRVELPVVTA